MWISDVYYGSSLTITAYLSTFSKTLGIAIVWLIFYNIVGNHILYECQTTISLISLLTMTVGNMLAITQKSIKRLMAYSSISQAGYIVMGFIGGTNSGISAIFYYLYIYTISNIAVFSSVAFFKRNLKVELLDEYKGLAQKSPFMSLVMLTSLLSLAGIPPLSGFIGKLFLFNVAAASNSHGLVFAGAVNSTISLYYYLSIIKKIYIDDNDTKNVYEMSNDNFCKPLSMLLLSFIILLSHPIFYENIHLFILT